MNLSLIHMAGENAISQLAEKAQEFMKADGHIVIFNPSDSPRTGDVNGKEIEKIFLDNGFSLIESKEFTYSGAAQMDALENPKDRLRQSPKELQQYKKNEGQTKELKGRFIIMKK